MTAARRPAAAPASPRHPRRGVCQAGRVDVDAAERRLTALLAGWAAASMATGSVLALVGSRRGQPAVVAFGRQTALWGAVDGVIAGAGGWARRRPVPPGSPLPDPERRRQRLHRILLVNSGLDVGYLAAGMGLLLGASRLDRRWAGRGPKAVGDGAAVVVQAGFLLVLDTVFASRLAGTRP